MGELARRRNARDLWISHGHLRAAGVGVVSLLIAAFVAGASLRGTPSEEGATATWLADEADAELVELLARVDAAGEPDGGLSRLTFPTALAAGEAVPVAPPFEGPGVGATHAALGAGPGAASVAVLPPGWAVLRSTASRAQADAIASVLGSHGLSGVAVEEKLTDGKREVRVGIAGLTSRAEADALQLRLQSLAPDEMSAASVVEVFAD